MAATKKKEPTTTNGFNGRNGHVSLAREEYDAYRALDEKLSEQAIENAKLQTRNVDQMQTLDAQARHLSSFELKVMHLERIAGLQDEYIAILKDKEKVLGMQELSEFWRQWSVATANGIDGGKLKREEVAKFEPDLFNSWRAWVNNQGRIDRTLSVSGSRAEIEANQPQTQAMMQTHMLAKKNEENARLAARITQLEKELGEMKVVSVKP